jgi:hypothetical protein
MAAAVASRARPDRRHQDLMKKHQHLRLSI